MRLNGCSGELSRMSVIDETAELTERERTALDVVKEHGGIHQSEFWKALDVSSRTGSRLLSNLEEKGVVEREETVYEGRVTYYVTPVHHAEELDFSLLMAGDLFSPFLNADEIDPDSPEFTQWLMELAAEE